MGCTPPDSPPSSPQSSPAMEKFTVVTILFNNIHIRHYKSYSFRDLAMSLIHSEDVAYYCENLLDDIDPDELEDQDWQEMINTFNSWNWDQSGCPEWHQIHILKYSKPEFTVV